MLMAKPIIGVMGPGAKARSIDLTHAYELGQQIAASDWILLTGGRNVGVMEAASRGAQALGGLTLGILPDQDTSQASSFLDIAICTGLGQARNVVNVLSSNVVIACGLGLGTASEIALALKHHKPVILLGIDNASQHFFLQMANNVYAVETVAAAIKRTQSLIAG